MYLWFKYAISSQGIAMATMRFRFDGQPINETDTPISLEMEEGDTIEVYQQQTGGRRLYIAC
jgi:small ubiquitin-related modifier